MDKKEKMSKQQAAKCAKCGKEAVKDGTRKNKMQSMQRYKCSSCSKTFTLQQIKSITYPIQTILKSLSAYNLGYSLKQTQERIEKSEKIKIPLSTIFSWAFKYKNFCTLARIRKQAIKLYKPKNIISKQTLNHIQPYIFKCHKAKLDILLKENPKFSAIKNYIEKINLKQSPHHIFTYNKNKKNKK